MRVISEQRCFGGTQGVYAHDSAACGCEMTFGLFLPPVAERRPVPVLWYLSGLTCTHENAMVKAGAQARAARAGIALVFPDTSPRGPGVSDHEDYDLGQGAGFYVDATEAPWAPHFRMWDYVAEELPTLIGAEFAVDLDRQIAVEQERAGITDVNHYAYPTFAKAAIQRRDNLAVSVAGLEAKLAMAKGELKEAEDELRKIEVLQGRDVDRRRVEEPEPDFGMIGVARAG